MLECGKRRNRLTSVKRVERYMAVERGEKDKQVWVRKGGERDAWTWKSSKEVH